MLAGLHLQVCVPPTLVRPLALFSAKALGGKRDLAFSVPWLVRILPGGRVIATHLSWERELLLLVRNDSSRRRSVVEKLHERHRDEVFGFLRRLSGDRQLAEDLLQETFFRVYTHLDRCDPEQSFRSWLYEIARNIAIDALRRRSLEKKAPGKGDRTEKSRGPST
jgi:hypothetical protein